MPLSKQRTSDDAELDVRPQFARTPEERTVPLHRIPAGEMAPETAYQVVHDELLLDGNSRLNLATFVTTWMEPEAARLMDECRDKNMIDKDEYPQTAELENRCVSMLADLWNSPAAEEAVGCSTTGSSEAAMLGGLALLRRWRSRGQGTGRPNLVMGANVQVCWEKFCRYWDVEARMVPLATGRTHLTADTAVEHCDENTIGVVAILGSTFDGTYEPVEAICAALDAYEERTGTHVPVHVDGASGGFVAPFLDPGLVWDFRLPRVVSINASGHKYGLVYPGVGWALWRDRAALPEELVFHVDYLGGSMPTFALNFSRPGAQVVAQYYTLLRLGFDGYRRVHRAARDTADWLSGEIAAMGPFALVGEGGGIPAFAFRLREDVTDYTVFDLSDVLRMRGWIVPAYHFPAGLEDLAVLRVVVRNGFSRNLAQLFRTDLANAVERLAAGSSREHPSFHH